MKLFNIVTFTNWAYLTSYIKRLATENPGTGAMASGGPLGRALAGMRLNRYH